MKDQIRWRSEAELLQASAIVVAAPRYMGAFASAIGVDVLAHWPIFASIEILSGAAMAILEGWAVAFMFRKWRSMPPLSAHWWVLLLLQFLLMLALPATATPYLVSSQLKEPVSRVLSTELLWAWSFTVAAIAPLVLAAVGYADVDLQQEKAVTLVAVQKQEQIEQGQDDPVLAMEIAQAIICPDCDRSDFTTVQALNAHKRFCKGNSHQNGASEEIKHLNKGMGKS